MTRPLVMKFGGSSLADTEKIGAIADIVVRRRRQDAPVVVVVSAMGRTTDGLIEQARDFSQRPDLREMDMLLTAGERISAALVAIALNARGVRAVSLTGSQAGIITDDAHTNARIIEVRPFRVKKALEEGCVVVVGGFQGVSFSKEVTTLGRGGSDVSAVALAAALGAATCEIYSDVTGVYAADPRIVKEPERIAALGYQEMQELAEAGVD
ncbi:MAG TPA: aspartate kinase, partial [bacterium]|nr:aspartate kinase [bacterium]